MITLNQIKKILTSNKSYLQEKYFVEEIGIFGSFSRGEQTKRSDIDLLVSLKKPIGLEFVDLSYELERLLKNKVDLVSKGAVKQRLMNEIAKDIIYV
ncbi:MAG: DNA polymerase beta domain-containing protein [Stygiobacter sp.]|nr:MAG: DNA polymerase beta domain-containing protein [Stygiobacter sp.]KAF0211995.1 MAG: DNA polymerase beta domain-containing [Ignavibacteria bacterium]